MSPSFPGSKIRFAILLLIISLAGCGGGGGGNSIGSAGGDVTFDNSAAAEQAAEEVLGVSLVVAVGVEVNEKSPSALELIDIIQKKIKNKSTPFDSIPIGIVDSDACTDGGNYNDTYDETITPPITVWTGTITFNNCNENGVIFNGSIDYSSTYNSSTDNYEDAGDGVLTVRVPSIDYNAILRDLSYSTIGNIATEEFSINVFTYIYDPNIGDGYSVNLDETIVGDLGNPCVLSDGVVLIDGANDTQARATVNVGTVHVEYDPGTGFVQTTNSPLSCPF